MSQHSLKILRYSLAFLFFWFGTQQLMNPDVWVVFLPEWLGYIPIPAEMFVQLNGWMEVVGSVLLFFGVFTRAASFVLSLHLFFIALSVGGAVGVRDAVLAFAGFALAASKGDEWTVDRKYWSR
jgi:uncharacterized membrane protein YphA (DoxX/SURF4 family)